MKLSALRPAETTPTFEGSEPTYLPAAKPWADVGTYRNDEAEIVIEFPIDADMAHEFLQNIEQIGKFRQDVSRHAEELLFLSRQLEDPDLRGHPKRGWAVKRRERLVTEILPGLNQMAVFTHFAQIRWQRMPPDLRTFYGMDAACGVEASVNHLAETLFLIRDGPLQDAAPLPADWEPPPEFYDCFDVEFLMTIGIVPF